MGDADSAGSADNVLMTFTSTIPKSAWGPSDQALQVAIAISGVSKSFGDVQAVSELTLDIKQGETVALLGPNGAGKSTAIAIVLGMLNPDLGTVRLFGETPQRAGAVGRIGAVLQDGGLMPGVRIRELLTMLSGLFPTPLPVDQVLQMTELSELGQRRIDRLSGGQLQRVRVAGALIGDPQLLVLDEPTSAMDVETRRSFWQTMNAEAARGRTIIFSTHHLEEADAFARRVIVLSNGRLVADGTPAVIKRSIGHTTIRFTSTAPSVPKLRALASVVGAMVTGSNATIRTTDAERTLRALLDIETGIANIEVTAATLEEAFIAITHTPNEQGDCK
jgi:ABC-2 type transport system ATP-binding protein